MLNILFKIATSSDQS